MTTRLLGALLLLGACHHGGSSPDLAPSDMAQPYPRTMVTGTLQPTSPQNLLLDPLNGGDGSPLEGEFVAVYDDNEYADLTRTFQSNSPVGGNAAVEELRGLHAGGGSNVYVLDDFLGGAGQFSAKIWISLGDKTATPIPFAQGAAAVRVALVDENVTGTALALAPATSGPVKHGDREWMLFTTTGSAPIPGGGWLEVTLSDLTLTMQLAAPEVTSTSLGGTSSGSLAVRTPLTAGARAAITAAKRLHHENRMHRHHDVPRAR